MSVTESDFRGEKAIAEAYSELFGDKVEDNYDLMDADEEVSDAVFANCCSGGTCMGGYPFFTQDDSRSYKDELAGHMVLLFRSDSESGGEGWDNQICWGDMGVGNFFITPEDLAKRDFSHVLYN